MEVSRLNACGAVVVPHMFGGLVAFVLRLSGGEYRWLLLHDCLDTRYGGDGTAQAKSCGQKEVPALECSG